MHRSSLPIVSNSESNCFTGNAKCLAYSCAWLIQVQCTTYNKKHYMTALKSVTKMQSLHLVIVLTLCYSKILIVC